MTQTKFHRISEYVEISIDFITCGEYQVFIDEKLPLGLYHQPDHWKTNKFPPQNSKKPIAGIRASDAEEFCQWFTQKYPSPGCKYRLPSIAEFEIAQEFLSQENQIGCWCIDGNQRVIGGIHSEQWQIWQEQLMSLCQNNFHRDIGKDFSINFDLVSIFDLSHDCKLSSSNIHFQMLSLSRELALSLIKELALFKACHPDFNVSNNRSHYQTWLFHVYRILSLIRKKIRSIFSFLSNLYKHFLSQIVILTKYLIRSFHYIYTYVGKRIVVVLSRFNRNYKNRQNTKPPHELIFDDFLSLISNTDNILKQVSQHQQRQIKKFRSSIYSMIFSQLSIHLHERVKQLRDHTDRQSKDYENDSICYLAETFGFNLSFILDFEKNLYFIFSNILNRSLMLKERDTYQIRYNLSVSTFLYQTLFEKYEGLYENHQERRKSNVTKQESYQLTNSYKEKMNLFFNLYAFFILLAERQENRFSVWEGILVVRERNEF